MQIEKVDRTLPSGKWEFDASVTDVFDDMLRRSIPQYDVMRAACVSIASRFIKPDTYVVDLGCSRGEAMRPLVDKYGVHNRFVGVEVSEPMREAARESFAGYVKCGVVDIKDLDLRRSYPPVRASVTLAVLTLQFIPIEYRQRVVRDIYKHTVAGGAVILVEKVLGATAELDSVFVDTYYDLKREHGYTQDQIDRKRLSLEGVLVPVTARWNEELLASAGFRAVDCFWRWANFAGWVGVRE